MTGRESWYWDVCGTSTVSSSCRSKTFGIGHGQAATLTLTNGAARFVVEGKFEEDGAGVGRPGFASEIDADGKALQQIRPKLIPVLEGKGPIVLSVGSTSRELPVAGLAKPLSGFKSVCFGQRLK